MRTEYLTLDGGPDDSAKLGHAARVLAGGGLVAFPTETSYVVAADAHNPTAVAALTRVLGGTGNKSLPLLVQSLRHAETLVGGFSRAARKLARVYWPGPLTLIVPQPDGSQVALRLPEHPVARALLAHRRAPLAAARASRPGAPEPLSAPQVRDALNGEISLIVDGGSITRVRPLTVVQIGAETVDVQAPEGSLSAAQILQTASPTMLFVCTGNTCRSPMAAGLCQAALESAGGSDALPYRVLSAGTNAVPGQSAHPLAVAAMKEVNIDISRHRVTNLSFEIVDTADWIFAMTAAQRDSILSLMPECADRLQLLSSNGEDVPEPGGYSLDRYRQARDKILACVTEALRSVRRQGG